MLAELKYIPTAWNNVRGSKSFRNQLIFSLLLFVVAHLHNFYCLRMWQGRPGIQINDMVLNLMQPMDFSLPIFIVEYSAILLGAAFVLVYPVQFVRGLQMFALMMFARTFCIAVVALEPPVGMVPLWDPVANLFLHTHETFVTKDLFFSGHIGALSIVMLISLNKYVKAWVLTCTVIVALLLMWQHVHYSSDVIFAPLASYVAYKIVNYVHRQTQYGLDLEPPQPVSSRFFIGSGGFLVANPEHRLGRGVPTVGGWGGLRPPWIKNKNPALCSGAGFL